MNPTAPENIYPYLGVLLSDLEDAIVCQTADGVTCIWSPGAERLFGFSAREALGTRMELFESATIPDSIRLADERIGPIERHCARAWVKTGRCKPVQVTICTICDTRGEVESVVYTVREALDSESQAMR